DKIACSLSLMRRLPPNKVEQNLSGLLNLTPEDTDELLQRVDQPLEEATCTETVGVVCCLMGLNPLFFPQLICSYLSFFICFYFGLMPSRAGSSCFVTTTETETATGVSMPVLGYRIG